MRSLLLKYSFVSIVLSVWSGFGATTTIDGVTWEWEYIGNSYLDKRKITGVGNATGSVVIPSVFSSIGNLAFNGCDRITSVTIPQTITSIDSAAFSGCRKLSQILVDANSKLYCSVDGVLYNASTTELIRCPEGRVYSMTIPRTVTTINSHAFYGCADLEVISVNSENTQYASYGGVLYTKDKTRMICCPAGRTTVTLPASLSVINDEYQFEQCSKLTSISVPSDNEKFCSYDGVLYDKLKTTLIRCPRAKSGIVNVPEGVVYIGNNGHSHGFKQCGKITGVRLPTTTTLSSFGSGAGFEFSGCTSLTTIEVAQGNTSLCMVDGMLCRDRYAYDYSSETSYKDGKVLLVCPGGLTSVVIPDEVKEIADRAFAGSALTQVVIPEGVKSIGVYAFSECPRIASILIPISVTRIGSYAFGFNTNLSSVVFFGCPGIDENVLYGCESLKTIICTGNKLPYGNYHYDSEWDWTGNENSLCNGAPLCHTLIRRTGATSAGPYDVGDYDWKDMTFVSSVDSPYPPGGPYCEIVGDCQLSYTVGADGTVAVCGGVSRTSIESDYQGELLVPEKLGNRVVTSIGARAFEGCKWLSTATVPTNVLAVGNGAFDGSGLVTVVSQPGDTLRVKALLQNAGVNVGSVVFKECQTVDGVVWEYQVLNGGAHVLGVNEALASMEIPPSLGGMPVVELGTGAFAEGAEILSISIPECVQTICDDAFDGCVKLETLAFEGDTPTLAPNAFRSVPSTCLVCVKKASSGWGSEIPGSWNGLKIQYAEDVIVTETTNGVQWMVQMDGGLIPSSVRSVAAQVSGSIVLPSRIGNKVVTSVGQGLLAGATKLKSVTIPSSVKNIEAAAFERCSDLESVLIPEGVETIGDNAFRECVSLKTITIPSTVTNIGSFAFKDCRRLEDIELRCENVAIGVGAFETKPVMEEVATERVEVTVTNVVIHYVVNSVVPEKSYPATYDTGFVNVITEVKSGGAVSVPATWMVNYPSYVTKFGADFTKSLMKPTGKRDGAGNAMCVWQDYVAGTDPTDEKDVFTASITMVDGQPVISYTPELNDAEKALRVYKTWGKVKLQDADWVEVPDGHNADYNFFKVTVEMK